MFRLPPPLRPSGLLLLLLGALQGAGCGPPVRLTVVELPQDHPLEVRSQTAGSLLAQTALTEGFDEQPLAVLEALDWLPEDPSSLFAVAELAFLKAEEVEATSPALAETLYVMATVRAFDFLHRTTGESTQRAEALSTYNWALGRYLALLQEREAYPPRDHQVSFGRETVLLRVDPGDEARGEIWEPEYFDRLQVAGTLGIRGVERRFVQPGVGAAMVGFRENRHGLPIERYYPPEGIVRPVTAVLHFETPKGPATPAAGAPRHARLVLYNPLELDTIPWDGRERPLAADFTAPLGVLTASTDLQKVGRLAVRNADKVDREAGVFLLQPFDPERIPVLMIHGLLSSPLAWRELTNEMMADPVLRRRYQIWHYFYPSALPYLYSGQRLETVLEGLYGFLQRDGVDHPALHRMVIVAHSMGGLLARTLISDSGETVWNRAATVRPEALRGTREDIALVREVFHFSPRPYVSRVIFLATPHRGSNLASSLAGRIGASLVNLPDDYEALFRRVTLANLDLMTPEMRKVMANGGPTSIEALSPKHPMIQVLAELAIDDRVQVHSIIGRKEGSLRLKESTDGIVPYWSSHLDEAESELIVRGGHGVYADPGAIQEIKRILYLHLEK
jgi:pimeloyl-ACP methyl ester carboxylesterase